MAPEPIPSDAHKGGQVVLPSDKQNDSVAFNVLHHSHISNTSSLMVNNDLAATVGNNITNATL